MGGSASSRHCKSWFSHGMFFHEPVQVCRLANGLSMFASLRPLSSGAARDERENGCSSWHLPQTLQHRLPRYHHKRRRRLWMSRSPSDLSPSSLGARGDFKGVRFYLTRIFRQFWAANLKMSGFYPTLICFAIFVPPYFLDVFTPK